MVNINSNDKPAVKIQGKYARPWFHDISIEGKNRFTYALFDSLANVGGVLGWSGDVAYSQAKDLPGFCKLVNDRYKVRLLFLEKYSSEHHIANTYVNLAKAEIYASFINNLLRPLFTRGIDLHSYPSPYQGILLTSRFADPSLYFKTSVYGQTAYLHTSSISRQNTGAKPFDDHDLISIYDLIKKSYPDTIKNHLLTVHLSTFLGNPNLIYPSFDSLLTDFKAVCKNNLYIRFLDSSFTVKKSQIFKKYTLEEAMSSRMKDINGSAITVKTVFKSRPVLIICWASWCGPCIREMPFEKKLQEQFKGKVDFIYLSFDKNKGAWEGKSKELNMDLNNYLLTNYFTSDFAKFYQISSLPFYLLYDKQGQKVELNNLRPSEATFADILKKLAN
ncbi:hypothetical protein GCM10007352_33740 [Mucilaginibacter phyllosphaerae]|nr:hypothetical protein GCM10007352_33740 [Mucilaginibacter phyllosphaerae]